MKAEQEENRYLWVDVLRGIAILLVLAIHTGNFGAMREGFSPSLSTLLEWGARGVQLFFVMSAFTIMLSYVRHRQTETLSVSNFFIRRFFRIAPMFYVLIVFCLVFGYLRPNLWFGRTWWSVLWEVLASVTFLHGLNPYFLNHFVPGEWSIAVETGFYALFPFLLVKLNDPKKVVIAFYLSLVLKGVLFALLSAYPLIPHAAVWADYLFYYLPSQLPVFLIGFFLYFALTGRGVTTLQVGLIAAPFLLLRTLNLGSFGMDNGVLAAGLFFFVLALVVRRFCKDNPFWRALGWIGKISYSMYLTQFTMLLLLQQLSLADLLGHDNETMAALNFGLRFLIAVGLNVILSSITYLLVEKPMIRWGNRIVAKREARQALKSAAS